MAKKLARVSGELDLEIEDNVDYSLPVTYKIGGSAVDNTTYTAKFEIRDKVGDTGTALLALTVGSGITLSGATGIFTIAITDTQCVFGNREMVYALVVTSSGGNDIPLLHGKITSYAMAIA